MPCQPPNSDPPPKLPPIFTAERDTVWCGTPLLSVGVGCPGCAPSQPHWHPQPTRRWGGGRGRTGLGSVKALPSSDQNTPVLPTLLPALIQTIAPYWLL